MNRAPSKWLLPDLIESASTNQKLVKGIGYMPVRPMGNCFSIPARLKLAWAVFTGRADAVFWP